jgi:arsenate reductase
MRNFYYLSSCDSCKRIMGTLSLDTSINKIDIKKNPLNISQLEELHTISGSYEVLFSRRAQLYKQRDLKNKILSEETIKELLLEHYTFLKRPIIIFDKTLFIGNSAEVVAKVKAFLDEQ